MKVDSCRSGTNEVWYFLDLYLAEEMAAEAAPLPTRKTVMGDSGAVQAGLPYSSARLRKYGTARKGMEYELSVQPQISSLAASHRGRI
jgi:hypothetical protein